MKQNHQEKLAELLELSHELGREDRRLAILGEGNTSAIVDEETFLIKASGGQLGTLRAEQLVQVRFHDILKIMDAGLSDDETTAALQRAKVDAEAPKPSVESTFHAWLLKQEGVKFVGHTHPIAVCKILCSDRAEDFANQRMFPDEIVCCGPKSLLIDYVDPGTELAEAIRDGWISFVEENGFAPRVILLKNHGLIAIGASAGSVLATTFMAVKAAEIFSGACALGNLIFMPEKEVYRIHTRADEHYRQKLLKLTSD
jgi:rhamnose utilization protein RhaD (predicted bifunctional aldolase and dehydrogenase)